MYDDDKDNYAIVKYNVKTKEQETVMVVKGRSKSSSWAIKCEGRRTEKEREDGWTFYTEKTDLPVNDSTG
jgi:hypothetical protein